MIVLGYRNGLDEALQRRGLTPYYVVTAPPPPSPQPRRFRCVTDIENAQEILRAVLSAPPDDVAGVLSLHEMGVFGAAFLRQHLGLPGNADPGATVYFRDKYLQKNALPPEVARARCRYVPRGTGYPELAAELGDTFVVKPANGAGALRTHVVHSAEEYRAALEPFAARSDVDVVAESFVDGQVLDVNGVWCDGGLRWSSLSGHPVSPLSAARGGTMATYVLDRRRHPALFRRAEELAVQALTGLRAPDCVFHLEAFARGDELTFGECALRLAGGMSPRANQLTFGVDLFDAEINLALGREPIQTPVTDTPERLYGYALLRRSGSGKLTQEDFTRSLAVDEIAYDASPDAPVGPFGMVGYAIVSDPDELGLQRRVRELVRFNETG